VGSADLLPDSELTHLSLRVARNVASSEGLRAGVCRSVGLRRRPRSRSVPGPTGTTLCRGSWRSTWLATRAAATRASSH